MTKSIYLILSCLLLTATVVMAQDEINAEALKLDRADLQAQINALQGEVDGINATLASMPGWRKGATGVLGANFSGNDNWYAIENPFAQTSAYGLSAAGFANLKESKYFWNNMLNLNIQKAVTKPDEEADEVKSITDALDLSSLFGYNIGPKWAVSAEGRYSSTLLQFNDPGKLVASAGVTWLPIDNMVVIIHPLGYEKNWPGELVSAPGAKIGATYSTTIIPGVAWSSNLTAFVPYSAGEAALVVQNDAEVLVDYSTSDIVNYTWINSFSTNIWKGIGVGLNIGLRQDRQLADKFQVATDGTTSDNPLQMYYNLGLSYTL